MCVCVFVFVFVPIRVFRSRGWVLVMRNLSYGMCRSVLRVCIACISVHMCTLLLIAFKNMWRACARRFLCTCVRMCLHVCWPVHMLKKKLCATMCTFICTCKRLTFVHMHVVMRTRVQTWTLFAHSFECVCVHAQCAYTILMITDAMYNIVTAMC